MLGHEAYNPANAASAARGAVARARERRGAAPARGVRLGQLALPGGAQALGAAVPGERRVVQDALGHLARLRAAVSRPLDRGDGARDACGTRAGGGRRQSARAHLLALAAGFESVRALPAGLQRRRHAADYRRAVRRSPAPVHPLAQGGRRGVLVQRPVQPPGAQPRDRAHFGVPRPQRRAYAGTRGHRARHAGAEAGPRGGDPPVRRERGRGLRPARLPAGARPALRRPCACRLPRAGQRRAAPVCPARKR